MDNSGKPSTAQVVLLATSSALTAVFYAIYRRKSATATRLKEARKIAIDQDLKSVLMESPGHCIPYAVIEGVVRSVKDSLNSQFVDNCKGVIERLTLREQKMVWNRTTHIWNDCEKIIHQRTNTVPFDLASHDEGVATAVRVVRPLDAAELDLETTYENFHPVAQSLTDVIGHFISGERPKGVKETEEMLRLGADVTGVGELVLDGGLARLQPPRQGLPYFLSTLDHDALVRRQQARVRLWRLLTAAFGAAACVALFLVLRRRYARYRERRRLRAERDEFRARQRERLRELRPGEEDEEDAVSPSACVVCLGRERSCVFLECGHVCACDECHRALPEPKKCPLCRGPIERVVPLYNS
ncbi:mitochondrial ubiquitin ligase activator of NFKB 1 [Anguilla rostrata]|uniref:mitochondrial ubiquitin ligase activator of NFKB 1 n=1 Tax=Anguilla rostrata TaxID=7938 RepID=UPI0030D0F956